MLWWWQFDKDMVNWLYVLGGCGGGVADGGGDVEGEVRCWRFGYRWRFLLLLRQLLLWWLVEVWWDGGGGDGRRDAR